MASKKRASPAPKARARRSPEQARVLILDAAERVFAEHLPDVVGLKEVAREAGVSHALVTHYFGTYAELVESTLERHFERLRAELTPVMMTLIAGEADTRTMLTAHRRAIARAASDPATVRLAIWALLSGRVAADDFFPRRVQGLKLMVDGLEASSSAPREDLAFLLIASFALMTTWTVARRAFAGSLGVEPAREREFEEGFERRTDAMIDAFLRAAERRGR